MFGIDPATWVMLREGGSFLILLGFLSFFAKAYLKNVAKIADEVASSTSAHIQALTQVKDALGSLALQVSRNTDAVLKCKGPEEKETVNHERQRHHATDSE